MKKMFICKAATLAFIFAPVGAVSARAQDDEITSIDDFLEESAPENNATVSDANGAAEQSKAPVASASGVTQLDELSVESEIEAEQAKQAKKAEAVATIDAAEMQNTSKTVSKAINSASGVKVRKSGGMGSEGKINIRGMEGKNIKVLVNGVPVETQGNLGFDDIPIDQIADIEVYKGQIKYMEESVALSSIDIKINAIKPAPIQTVQKWNPGEAVKDAFESLLESGKDIVEWLIYFIIAVLPVLAILALPVVLVVWLIRRAIRKNKAKKLSGPGAEKQEDTRAEGKKP